MNDFYIIEDCLDDQELEMIDKLCNNPGFPWFVGSDVSVDTPLMGMSGAVLESLATLEESNSPVSLDGNSPENIMMNSPQPPLVNEQVQPVQCPPNTGELAPLSAVGGSLVGLAM